MKIFLKDIEQISKIIDSNGADITSQEMAKIRDGRHFVRQDMYERGRRDMQEFIEKQENDSPSGGKNKKQPKRDMPLPTFDL